MQTAAGLGKGDPPGNGLILGWGGGEETGAPPTHAGAA